MKSDLPFLGSINFFRSLKKKKKKKKKTHICLIFYEILISHLSSLISHIDFLEKQKKNKKFPLGKIQEKNEKIQYFPARVYLSKFVIFRAKKKNAVLLLWYVVVCCSM